MDSDLSKMAEQLLKTPDGAKLTEKKDDIEKLINSQEGQNVKNMLCGEESSLKKALSNGDMETLKQTLSEVLKTEDGAKLAAQIQNLMK